MYLGLPTYQDLDFKLKKMVFNERQAGLESTEF